MVAGLCSTFGSCAYCRDGIAPLWITVDFHGVQVPDGTYEFYAESSNSGGNGNAGGATRETGRWWVVGNLQAAKLCARNQNGENFQFELELRNHPKTGDPMIVLDGDAYVTTTQRQPWPDL